MLSASDHTSTVQDVTDVMSPSAGQSHGQPHGYSMGLVGRPVRMCCVGTCMGMCVGKGEGDRLSGDVTPCLRC